jgi:hypothetical protein
MYPYALLEGQGMGTAYEYYAKLRVMHAVFARTGKPHTLVALGLPEKHGYDLDFVLLAHELQASLWLCEDRPAVQDVCQDALAHLPDPSFGESVQFVQIDSLTHWPSLTGRHFDWAISTAAAQRLPDREIVTYIQNARQIADRMFLFIPNGGNRSHATLSELRGLEMDRVLALCEQAVSGGPPSLTETSRIIAAGYCDIPPFPPGLARSAQAKENAINSPIEAAAMRALEWWCRGEPWFPRPIKRKFAHLNYVALDFRDTGI